MRTPHLDRRNLISLVVIVAASLVLGRGAADAAGIWYVSPTGDDANDCQTSTTPCATIDGAISKASAGDTIYVATGTYTGTGDRVVSLSKSVELSGGWDETFSSQVGTSTVDGEGLHRGMIVSTGVTAVLRQFTIRNGFLACCGPRGAGIFNSGNLTLLNTTVDQNVSSYGGAGIYNLGNLVLDQATVSRNEGGGLFNAGGATLLVQNSTLSGNTLGTNGIGGGLANNGADAVLNNTTVTGNSAVYGGGVGNLYKTVTLKNTIVAGNAATDMGADCSGAITSAGYNLMGTTAGCSFAAGTGDQTGVDLSLGPLQANGGMTATHALGIFSPAIDSGNPATPGSGGDSCEASDQRGLPRVGRCDIGSFESQTVVVHAFLPMVLRSYCNPIYFDDFSDPASGWPIDDGSDVSHSYVSGEYQILVKSNYWWAAATAGARASNGYYAADVRNSTGTPGSYGLLFGLSDDWSRFYTFEVDNPGNYYIYKYDDPTWTLLASGSSASIRTGTATNSLKIERNGSLLKAYANGALLASLTEGSYTGDLRAGLTASSFYLGSLDARFDNFTILPLSCEAQTISAPQGPSGVEEHGLAPGSSGGSRQPR